MKKTFQKIKLYENSKKLQKPVLSISPSLIYLYWGGNSKNSGRIYFSVDSIVVKLNNKEGSISFNYEGEWEYEGKNKFEIKKVKNKYKIIFEDYKDYYSFSENYFATKSADISYKKIKSKRKSPKKSKRKSPKKSKRKSPNKSKRKSPKKSKRKSPKKSKVKQNIHLSPRRKMKNIIKITRKKTAAAIPSGYIPSPGGIISLGTEGWERSMTKLKFEVQAEGTTDGNFYYLPCCTGNVMPYQYGSYKAVFFLKAFTNSPKDFGNQELFTSPVKKLPVFFPEIAVRLNPEFVIERQFANYVIVMPMGLSNNIIAKNSGANIHQEITKNSGDHYDPREFIEEMNLGHFFGEKDIGLQVKLIRTKIHENLWSDYKTYGFFENEEQFSKNKTTSSSKSLHKKRNPYSVGAKSRRENRHSYKKENRNKFMNELYFGIVELGNFNLIDKQFNETALARICHKLADLEHDGLHQPYIYLDIKSNNMCTKYNITSINDETNIYLVDFDTKYCKPVILTSAYNRDEIVTKLKDIMILGYLVAEMFGNYTIEILKSMLFTFEKILNKYINLSDDGENAYFTLFDNLPFQVIKMAAERWRHYGRMAIGYPQYMTDPESDKDKERECSHDGKIYNYKILELLAKVYQSVLAKTRQSLPSDRQTTFYKISNHKINIVDSTYDQYINEKFSNITNPMQEFKSYEEYDTNFSFVM